MTTALALRWRPRPSDTPLPAKLRCQVCEDDSAATYVVAERVVHLCPDCYERAVEHICAASCPQPTPATSRFRLTLLELQGAA